MENEEMRITERKEHENEDALELLGRYAKSRPKSARYTYSGCTTHSGALLSIGDLHTLERAVKDALYKLKSASPVGMGTIGVTVTAQGSGNASLTVQVDFSVSHPASVGTVQSVVYGALCDAAGAEVEDLAEVGFLNNAVIFDSKGNATVAARVPNLTACEADEDDDLHIPVTAPEEAAEERPILNPCDVSINNPYDGLEELPEESGLATALSAISFALGGVLGFLLGAIYAFAR